MFFFFYIVTCKLPNLMGNMELLHVVVAQMCCYISSIFIRISWWQLRFGNNINWNNVLYFFIV